MPAKRKSRKGRKRSTKNKIEQPSAIAESYLEKRQSLDREGTFRERKRAVERFIIFLEALGMTLMDISKETITDFFSYLRKDVSINTAHQQLALVKSFVKWAYEVGKAPDSNLIFTTSLRSELPKKSKKQPNPPSQEQMKKILNVGPPEQDTILRLLYESGMRLSDLLNLKVSNFNPKERTLKIFQVKQQTERTTQLTKEGAHLLSMYIKHYRPEPEPESEDILFISKKTKKGITGRTIERWVSKLSVWIDRPITPHMIRAAMATHMLENGADIRQVQKIGGWESLSTLEHYADVSRREQKRVWNETHPLAKTETEDKIQQQEAILKDNVALLSQMEEMLKQMRKISGQED